MRKKASFKRLPELFEMSVINSNFSYFLLVSLFVSRDLISLNLKENNFISVFYLHSAEAYLEPNRTSMMECFPSIVNG